MDEFAWTTGGDPFTTHMKKISHGGYGEVHQMRNTMTAEVFARKLVRQFAAISESDIQNEIRAIDKLCGNACKYLVMVFRHGKLKNTSYYFIDMELCDLDLKDYILGNWHGINGLMSPFFRRGNQESEMENIWGIMRQISEGLVFIHSQTEVHRDLKPTNGIRFSFIDNSEVLYSVNQGIWKIADFGLTSERASGTSVSTQLARGTPGYRAPELFADPPTFSNKIDIWGLGCILYELVVKKKAFQADWDVLECASSKALPVILHSESSIDMDSRKYVTNLIGELLQVRAQERPSAQEVYTVLKSLSSGQSKGGQVIPLLSRISQPASDLISVSRPNHGEELERDRISELEHNVSMMREISVIESARSSQPATASIFDVPFERNPYFTGRNVLLERLRFKLYDNQPNQYNHRVSLHGLGGIGKTQIALEYAYIHQADYTYTFWISGIDQARLLSGFNNIAKVTACRKETPGESLDGIAKSVLEWLRMASKWLLVIDNLDDVAVVDGYLPAPNGAGHTLITTRNKSSDGIPAQGLEVTTMEKDESVQFLLKRIGQPPLPGPQIQAEIERIVGILGLLPLAIEHAAAYIRESQNITEFLDSYKENRRELLDWRPVGNYPYQYSVAATWRMSLRRLQISCPNAVTAIQYLAFLNPDEILIEFLKAGAKHLRPEARDNFENNFRLRESLNALQNFSLIRVSGEGMKISIHRLVQVVVRDDLSKTLEALILTDIVRLGLGVFPDISDQNHRETCRRYRSQAIACLGHSNRIVDPEWHRLAGRVALYLQEDGFYRDCLHWSRLTFEIRKTLLGLENSDTLVSMNALALAYFNIGKWIESAEIFVEAFAMGKEIVGTENPETSVTMTGLAWACGRLGLCSEEVKLHKIAFEIRKRVLGEGHPDTLMSMNGLAWGYDSLGECEAAAMMYHRTLEISKSVLGQEHPDTLWSMDRLAATYIKLQRYIEAQALHQEALEKRKRILGAKHPEVVWSLNGLAETYSNLGLKIQAAALYHEALDISRSVLGDEHPDTLWSMNGLAVTYTSSGEWARAEALFRETMRKRRKTLGNRHPDTLWSMTKLAEALERLGRHDEATEVLNYGSVESAPDQA